MIIIYINNSVIKCNIKHQIITNIHYDIKLHYITLIIQHITSSLQKILPKLQ